MFRPSNIVIIVMLVLGLLTGAVLVHAMSGIDRGLQQRAELVGQLGLTDLALFTEARYTRHISMADLHSAFQDHPGSFDHFPTGSLIAPPRASFSKCLHRDCGKEVSK